MPTDELQRIKASHAELSKQVKEATSKTPVDRLVVRPRGQRVTIEMTANQADTLWWLLKGEIDRDQFRPKTMRTLKEIAKRVDAACGFGSRVDG